MVPPFVEVGGRLYAVVNWTPDMDVEPERLAVRRLGGEEAAMVRSRLRDALFEAWAILPHPSAS